LKLTAKQCIYLFLLTFVINATSLYTQAVPLHAIYLFVRK